jgi:hypothetical protein
MPARQYYGDAISLDTAAAILGRSRKTLLRWHAIGYGPPRQSTHTRRAEYSRTQVKAWKAEHGSPRHTSTTKLREAAAARERNCTSGHKTHSDSERELCERLLRLSEFAERRSGPLNLCGDPAPSHALSRSPAYKSVASAIEPSTRSF